MTSQGGTHRRPRGAIALLAAAAALAAACGGGSDIGAGAVQTLEIAPPASSLATGSTVQLAVTAVYADGTRADVTALVRWLSSNSAVAVVISVGQLVAVSAGSATISAHYDGVRASAPLTVTGPGGTVATGYAYVASADAGHPLLTGAVYQYTIQTDGSWAPMSSASVPAGVRPVAMVADPSDRYVYVINSGDGTISQYAVGTGGALVPLSPPTVAVSGSIPVASVFQSVTVNPGGRYLYVVTHAQDPAPGASIAQYSIGADGALMPLVPAAVTVPAFAGDLRIDPSGQFAYVVSNVAPRSEILELSVGADGTLAVMSPGSVAAPNPVTMTITADGQRAYVLGASVGAALDGEVTEFAIGADGQLTAQGMPTLTGGLVEPVELVFGGPGSSAYLLVSQIGVDTDLGAVDQYQISSDGALIPYAPGTVGASPGPVAAALYGPNLFVLGANALGNFSTLQSGGNIDRYTVDPSGTLTPAGTMSLAASLPVAMVLMPAR